MELSSKTLKRIGRDINLLQTSSLIEEKIYVMPDETDITLVRVCIIGPENTPYENGIYFFEVKFPSNYPFSPPKVKYLTTDGKSRMHPNYYCCGKVCVSIIGTWSGPGWTSCQSLSSVLITLRSLFIENPLWQEPGFNGEISERNSDYNTLIKHENIRIGILKMVEHPPIGFEIFNEIITQHLINNKLKIMEFCDKELHNNNKEYYSPSIYNFSKVLKYNILIDKLNIHYSKLNDDMINEHISMLLSNIKTNTITFKDFNSIHSDLSDQIDIELSKIIILLVIKNKIKINSNNNNIITLVN